MSLREWEKLRRNLRIIWADPEMSAKMGAFILHLAKKVKNIEKAQNVPKKEVVKQWVRSKGGAR